MMMVMISSVQRRVLVRSSSNRY